MHGISHLEAMVLQAWTSLMFEIGSERNVFCLLLTVEANYLLIFNTNYIYQGHIQTYEDFVK
jgi:hypothetical protein